MSRVVPPMIQAFARGGAPWAYLFDLIPHAGDSWAQKRYATNAVNVDDEDYDEALAKTITRIVQTADIEGGGGIAAFAEVDVKLINQSKLHEDFLADNPTGRKAKISLAAIGPNLVKNSTFGKYVTGTPHNFENWTEVLGTGGGAALAADSVNKYEGGNSVVMLGGATTESSIECNSVKIRNQQRTTYSWYTRGPSVGGGEQIDVIIYFGGAYYDVAAGTFGGTPVLNTFTVSAPQTWERNSITFDWPSFAGSSPLLSARIKIQTRTGTIGIDAVQIEGQALSDYYHNRYELADTDVMTLYTASVRQAPKWNLGEVELKLEPWHAQDHKDIPDTSIKRYSDDNSKGWKVPSGPKCFPITFGWKYSEGEYMWDWVADLNAAFARGICVNLDPDATDGIEVYFDRPDIKLAVMTGAERYLMHFAKSPDKKSGRYYHQMYDDRATPHYAALEFVDDCVNKSRFYQHADAGWLLEKRAPWMILLKGEVVLESTANMLNPANAIDGDLSTFAQNTNDDEQSMKVKGVQHALEHTTVLGLAGITGYTGIYVLGDFKVVADGGGTHDIEFQMQGVHRLGIASLDYSIINNGVTGDEFRNTPGFRGAGIPAATHKMTDLPVSISSNRDTIRKISDGMKFKFTLDESDNASTNADCRIYECGVRIDFATDIKSTNFAAELFGRAYQTTWNSRYTATDPVREPSTIIESICRHELGAVDADIDMTAFDSVQTARSGAGWYGAGQIIDQVNSKDVIKKICKEFGLLYFIDEEGKHNLKALGWGTAVPTLSLGDFYKPHEMLKFEVTDSELVITDFELRYRKDQFLEDDPETEKTDERYRMTAYCDRTQRSPAAYIAASYVTKCSNAYAALGNVDRKLTLSADWIYDEQTAANVLKQIIDWRSAVRIKVSGELFFDNLGLEIGNIVALDSTFSDYLPTAILSASRFVVTEDRIKRSAGRVGVKLLEVKQP